MDVMFRWIKMKRTSQIVISAKFKSHGGVLVSMAYPCPMTFKMSESLQTNKKAFQFEHKISCLRCIFIEYRNFTGIGVCIVITYKHI